jgi:hypothetical protein
VVRYLVGSAGADPSLKDDQKVRSAPNRPLLCLLYHLVMSGFSGQGWTPFAWALHKDATAVIEYLLEASSANNPVSSCMPGTADPSCTPYVLLWAIFHQRGVTRMTYFCPRRWTAIGRRENTGLSCTRSGLGMFPSCCGSSRRGCACWMRNTTASTRLSTPLTWGPSRRCARTPVTTLPFGAPGGRASRVGVAQVVKALMGLGVMAHQPMLHSAVQAGDAALVALILDTQEVCPKASGQGRHLMGKEGR